MTLNGTRLWAVETRAVQSKCRECAHRAQCLLHSSLLGYAYFVTTFGAPVCENVAPGLYFIAAFSDKRYLQPAEECSYERGQLQADP